MRDRTEQAVKRQLKAMGCERFDVGIRDVNTTLMMNKSWTVEEVLGGLAWLKRMNAQGNDIYIRPVKEENHGLILLDDLDVFAIEVMKESGKELAVIVETSPKNFQAWLKLPSNVDANQRKEIARELAKEHEADPNSADATHYGRLAGFTNRKDKYTDKRGLQPWVLLRESTGRAAKLGSFLIESAVFRIEEGKKTELKAIVEQEKTSNDRAAIDVFLSEMKGLTKRFDDLSRCDFIAAMKLFDEGYTKEVIENAMLEGSPELEKRKGKRAFEYVQRTVARAESYRT